MKKKILMLTWEYPPNIVGGLSRHVEGLATGLSDLGYEVHIITTWIPGVETFEIQGSCEIYRVKPYNEESNFLHWVGGLNVAIVDQVLHLMNQHQYLFIHAHDWIVGAAAMTLKESYQLPLFTTVHATEYGRNQGIHTEMQKKIHSYEQALIDASDLIITCSPYMSEELHRIFGLSKQKMVMIPNGVDAKGLLPVGHHEILAKFPIDSTKKLVFSIGRLVKEKGFETMIEAAHQLRDIRDDIYFIIAGKGPMFEQLWHQVRELRLANVHFVGFISDMERDALFSICDLAVFPSLYEPFGIVALESLAHSKPTIVSEVGGLKGIIEDGVTGMYMQPGDALSLVEQINTLLASKEFAESIGEQGRMMVESRFSWQRIAEETKSAFDEFLFEASK